ncbi:actin-binding Rho-activating protein [Nothobranchius furzeri]|uniref:Actin-binding Rho-activating protein n=2 Tax=Nothobranchius furzeri TaxID=105023 RepID=A0A9D2XS99_NOTFU|nr:actin-binding Rho-activating protein [Nothobranchius furzeri]KAF7207526.1 transcript variant X1 [Nothobranchius furzeri]
MSSGGTATVTSPEPQSFKRAARKIKCAALVANLAKSWQGWAKQHSDKQDAIPSGWMPSSVEEDRKERTHVVKLTVTPRVIAADPSDANENEIRTGSVTKTVQVKRTDCSSSNVVNAIRNKMESGPEDYKPFLGNESPTRRRQMRALQSAGGGGMVQDKKLKLQEKKSGSSLDTEGSWLGEDGGLRENSESQMEQRAILTSTMSNKPKIKIATMSDIKSRWQQWSEQHTEGQKLNPFSEEFDYEYAMTQRLRKGDSGYGRPKDGSKTAERGDRAQKHIHREMEEMVWIIRDMGFKDKEGRTIITFGRLFDRYVKISDKVVGILLRCRKHKMLDFEGEMLWKGQDDDVIITLKD